MEQSAVGVSMISRKYGLDGNERGSAQEYRERGFMRVIGWMECRGGKQSEVALICEGGGRAVADLGGIQGCERTPLWTLVNYYS